MLGAYFVCEADYKHVRPVIVIGELHVTILMTCDMCSGPVLIGAGLMTILLSSEICVRYYRESKRSLDPELDNLTNPQVSFSSQYYSRHIGAEISLAGLVNELNMKQHVG